MTQQHVDTITIGGQNHWLARTAPILPRGLAERIGLEIEAESTANYKGWDARWKIELGRMWLAELCVSGFLGRKNLKKFEKCVDEAEFKAVWTAYNGPRRIDLKEIFGTEPPIFAAWVSQKLAAVSTRDERQYRRDHADGVTGAQTRFVGVENGVVVSDETIPNAQWDPQRSEYHRRQAEQEAAIRAAEEIERKRRAHRMDSD